MDTGTAPNAVSSVPKPTLIIMICTILSLGEMVFSNATIRAIAPVSCMMVTWNIEVATTSAIGSEANNPCQAGKKDDIQRCFEE